jgi:DNA-binding CsgD family transcriptional regulator/tetratricopeptide (TPR) repeat protein
MGRNAKHASFLAQIGGDPPRDGGHTSSVTVMDRGATLIARGHELELLEMAFARARNRGPITVVVAGDTGIGKSWLLTAFAARLGPDVVVARGRCLDYEGAGPPFDPFESIVAALPASGKRTAPRSASPLAKVDRPAQIRRRLVEAASAGPVVAIVEDLHWADPSSNDLFASLAADPVAGVLLIGTYRTDGLPWNHPLRRILTDLDRMSTNVRIDLEPLSRAETAALLTSRLATAPSDREVDAIFGRAAGNPLYSEHLLAASAETKGTMPRGLRDLIAARFSRLEPSARELLDTAAAIGDVVDQDLLAAVAAVGWRDLAAALEELVESRLLVPDPLAPRYFFSHPLIREVAHAKLTPARRERLHAAAAAQFEKREAAAGEREPWLPGGSVATIAHHLEAASLSRAALIARVDAGLAADAVQAPATAHSHYSRALWLWDRVAKPESAVGADRARVLELAAEAAFGAALVGEALPLIRAAVDDVTANGHDNVRLGLLHVRLGRMAWTAGQFEYSIAAYQRAEELVTSDAPAAARAVVLSGLMSNRMVRGYYEDLEAGSREAIERAGEAGDRKTEGHARNTLGVGLAFTGHPQEALASLEAARWIAEDLRDAEEMCRAYTNMGMVLMAIGRPAAAAAVARSGLETYRKLGITPCHGGMLAGNAAEALVRLGRWDEAVELGAEYLERPVDAGSADLRLTLARVAIGRGELDRAGRLIDQVRAFDQRDPRSLAAVAMLTAELQLAAGRPAYAWRQVEDGRQEARSAADVLLLAELCELGVRVERARLAIGLRAAARAASRSTLETLIAEIDGIFASAAHHHRRGELAALVAGARAEASAALGRSDPGPWAAAVAAWDACGHPYDAALARLGLAEAILAGRGSRATARTALDAAAKVATRLGAAPLRSAIDDLVSRSGISIRRPARVREKPVAAEPVAAEPVTPEPVAPEPVAPEPVAPEPVAPEPVAPEPIAAVPRARAATRRVKPVASEPVPTPPVEPAARRSATPRPVAGQSRRTARVRARPADAEPSAEPPQRSRRRDATHQTAEPVANHVPEPQRQRPAPNVVAAGSAPQPTVEPAAKSAAPRGARLREAPGMSAPEPMASPLRQPAARAGGKPVASEPVAEQPRRRGTEGRKTPVAPAPKPVASSGRPPAAVRAKLVDPKPAPKPVASNGRHPAASRPRQPASRARETPIALEPVAAVARPRRARGPAKPIVAKPVAPPSPLVGLTRRDLGILDLVAAGRTDEQIGEQLLITRQTASAHVSRIMRKLGVGSRLEAAEIARQSAAAGKS